MTRFLTVDDVVRTFERKLWAPAPVGDLGLLASTVGRPQATVDGQDAYPTLAAKAAALFHAFASTQAFVDGNKRIAVYAVGAFLLLNGRALTLGDIDMYDLAMRVAEGDLDVVKIMQTLDTAMIKVELEDE